MCEAKPGRRCAADTQDNVVVCMESYRNRHPQGPAVDPLTAAANTPQVPHQPQPAPPAPQPVQPPAPELPPPVAVQDLIEVADVAYTRDGHDDKWGADVLTDRVGFETSVYEETHLQPAAFARVRGAHDVGDQYTERLHHLLQRERQWRQAGYQPPGASVSEEDSMYGAVHTGDRYDSSRPLREVAKDVRKDIKEAVAAGYLPEDLTYRVRVDTKGTSAIRLYAEGMADEEAYTSNRAFGGPELVNSAYSRQVTERLEGLAQAYTRNQNNSMVDYFSNSAWVNAQVVSRSEQERNRAFSEFEKLDAQIRKARRERNLSSDEIGDLATRRSTAQQEYQLSRDKLEAVRESILSDRDRM